MKDINTQSTQWNQWVMACGASMRTIVKVRWNEQHTFFSQIIFIFCWWKCLKLNCSGGLPTHHFCSQSHVFKDVFQEFYERQWFTMTFLSTFGLQLNESGWICIQSCIQKHEESIFGEHMNMQYSSIFLHIFIVKCTRTTVCFVATAISC